MSFWISESSLLCLSFLRIWKLSPVTLITHIFAVLCKVLPVTSDQHLKPAINTVTYAYVFYTSQRMMASRFNFLNFLLSLLSVLCYVLFNLKYFRSSIFYCVLFPFISLLDTYMLNSFSLKRYSCCVFDNYFQDTIEACNPRRDIF